MTRAYKLIWDYQSPRFSAIVDEAGHPDAPISFNFGERNMRFSESDFNAAELSEAAQSLLALLRHVAPEVCELPAVDQSSYQGSAYFGLLKVAGGFFISLDFSDEGNLAERFAAFEIIGKERFSFEEARQIAEKLQAISEQYEQLKAECIQALKDQGVAYECQS